MSHCVIVILEIGCHKMQWPHDLPVLTNDFTGSKPGTVVSQCSDSCALSYSMLYTFDIFKFFLHVCIFFAYFRVGEW